MKAFGITVTAKMKHAVLWAAAKRLGGQSALAKALGVHQTSAGQWCNLQGVPSKQKMMDPDFQKRVFDATGQMAEDVFPKELRDAADFLKAPKTIEATQEFDVLKLAQMQTERLTIPSPEMTLQLQEQTAAIQSVLKTLSFREREIVKLRFGLGEDRQSYTLEEVGHIFKVTRERIRSIEAKAIRKLQQPTRAMVLEAAAV